MARSPKSKKKAASRGKSKPTKRKSRPKSKPVAFGDYVRQCAKAATALSGGRVLAIDPASGGTSRPGWAVFEAGVYIGSGTLAVEGATIQERLDSLRSLLRGTKFGTIDVLAIERIRGRLAHVYLTWAVGVTVSSFPDAQLTEVPVPVWKKYIKDDTLYSKTDEADAVAIGCAAISTARGFL